MHLSGDCSISLGQSRDKTTSHLEKVLSVGWNAYMCGEVFCQWLGISQWCCPSILFGACSLRGVR